MKSPIYASPILMMPVAAILLSFSNQSVSPIGFAMAAESTLTENPQTIGSGVLPASATSAPALRGSQPRMMPVEYKVDRQALNREKGNAPYEFRGGAGTGRVVDRKGKVLLESGEDIGIFGAVVGPDQEKVLVKGVDAKNLVIEPSTGRRITLPPRPPGANMLGFGDWHWIGPKQLFGNSGVERIFHEGPHENCVNDNNVAQTKFYTLDLDTGRLSEVAMPGAVTQPVVHVVELTSDGHIHLMNEKPAERTGQDLGWFKIEMPN